MKRKPKPAQQPTRFGAAAGVRRPAERGLRTGAAQKQNRPMLAELYHRAEVRLRQQQKSSPARAGAPQPPTGPERLLHELEVHQIELEMQNTELRKARDELELALENYTDLYDFAPVG